MRAFADAWPDPAFVQEVLAQLPWGHQLMLLERAGSAVTNVELRLPKARSDLARETLKDPY